MKFFKMLAFNLHLFEGGEGGGAAEGTGAESGAKGETIGAVPGRTRRGKSGEYANVKFGKQPHTADEGAAATEQNTVPAAGEHRDSNVTSNTLEERRQAYRNLVDGEFKDIYTEDTQRIINRRFKETSGLQQQVESYQPVIDMLMQRYNVGDGDVSKLTAAIENDDAYWSAGADAEGLTVEQYKAMKKLERENAALIKEQKQRQGQQAAQQQIQRWMSEEAETQKTHKNFSLQAELQNPAFMSMLKAGVPVQHAYEVTHMDEIKAGIAQMQAKATEKQVVDSIRAKGMRPQENGTSAQSAFTTKEDPSKWSKKDRAEVIRRAAMGEKIYL